MYIAVLLIYFISLSFLLLFCFYQLQLAWYYVFNNKKDTTRINIETIAAYPCVTIQLPVFNEFYMVERLLDNIVKINYPSNKIEIQILDDSNDETSEIIKNKITGLKDMGFDFSYIHRSTRSEFKAGALKEGLKSAKGEFIAIFDADFLPEPDFLTKTIPFFTDQKIAAVQTCWGHLNKNFSLLTRIQAFVLDAHFTVEKVGRESKGYFIEFNGTSGVWRKTAILDAGNWKADTLTEDLDLSYRTQLKGWKIKYIKDIVTPAELPVEMNAIKVQQFRWMKGGAQNLLKNFRSLVYAPLPIMTKLNGIFYLMNSLIFVSSFLIALFTYPMMLIQLKHPALGKIFSTGMIFAPITIFPLFYYGISYFSVNSPSLRNVIRFPLYFLSSLIIIIGLSFHNVIAVFEAFAGIKSSFCRTPKFNVKTDKKNWKKNRYIKKGFSFINLMELTLTLFFLWCIFHTISLKQYNFLSFYIILFLGFGMVSWLSLKKSSI